jgi:hypothetical protein
MRSLPHWTAEEFEKDRTRAIEEFRRARREEAPEEYAELFDRYLGVFENLIEATVDLTKLRDDPLQVLNDDETITAFSYLAGPPISEDDLATLTGTTSFTKRRLEEDKELVGRVIEHVTNALMSSPPARSARPRSC